MKKKILSLALALAMCLGLTLPAFASETLTETIDGITITARMEGSKNAYISYTGSGEFTDEHAHATIYWLEESGLEKNSIISISIGRGVVVSDGYKKLLNNLADREGWSISYDGSTAPVQPEQPQQPVEVVASPTNDKLEVDYVPADPTVYKIDGSNYFKIRDVAALLNGTEKQFAVGYDGSRNAVTLTRGQGYEKQPGDLAGAAKGGDQTAIPSNDAIYVDGEKITVEAYKINGSNYFKLRSLGKALNFHVGWSAERGMYIETGR